MQVRLGIQAARSGLPTIWHGNLSHSRQDVVQIIQIVLEYKQPHLPLENSPSRGAYQRTKSRSSTRPLLPSSQLQIMVKMTMINCYHCHQLTSHRTQLGPVHYPRDLVAIRSTSPSRNKSKENLSGKRHGKIIKSNLPFSFGGKLGRRTLVTEGKPRKKKNMLLCNAVTLMADECLPTR
ncbi:hypothetical protein BDZ45DRAFT_52009 [Acephala macrosclerotiorum]|nr:hypothetical protein BDZ45DRAFT_52009 [Acephala macrosclerotiorum]